MGRTKKNKYIFKPNEPGITIKTKEDAIKAKKAAEKEYFGEYARK